MEDEHEGEETEDHTPLTGMNEHRGVDVKHLFGTQMAASASASFSKSTRASRVWDCWFQYNVASNCIMD